MCIPLYVACYGTYNGIKNLRNKRREKKELKKLQDLCADGTCPAPCKASTKVPLEAKRDARAFP